MFMMTTPNDAAPDTVVEFGLSLTAQNDTSRVDVKTIPISASMVSVASVALNLPVSGDEHIVAAGEHITLKYTIWNNATRQDIFAMRVDVKDQAGWIVHQPTTRCRAQSRGNHDVRGGDGGQQTLEPTNRTHHHARH